MAHEIGMAEHVNDNYQILGRKWKMRIFAHTQWNVSQTVKSVALFTMLDLCLSGTRSQLQGYLG